MRIKMRSVEVDDEFRRRLRMYEGKSGLATRDEVRAWREENGISCDIDMFSETDPNETDEEEWGDEQEEREG